MTENKALVTILRRDESHLDDMVREAIQASFGARKVVYRRVDPDDSVSHLLQCQHHNANAIYLPDEPIPARAHAAGYPHIVFIPGKGLVALDTFVTTFKRFVPK